MELEQLLKRVEAAPAKIVESDIQTSDQEMSDNTKNLNKKSCSNANTQFEVQIQVEPKKFDEKSVQAPEDNSSLEHILFTQILADLSKGHQLRSSQREVLMLDFFKFKRQMYEKTKGFNEKQKVAIQMKEKIEEYVIKRNDIKPVVESTIEPSGDKATTILTITEKKFKEDYAAQTIVNRTPTIKTKKLDNPTIRSRLDQSKPSGIKHLNESRPMTSSKKVNITRGLRNTTKTDQMSDPYNMSKQVDPKSTVSWTKNSDIRIRSKKSKTRPQTKAGDVSPMPSIIAYQTVTETLDMKIIDQPTMTLPKIIQEPLKKPENDNDDAHQISRIPLKKLANSKQLLRKTTLEIKHGLKNLNLEELKIGGLSDDQIADQFENEVDQELENEEDLMSESRSDSLYFKLLSMRYEGLKEDLSNFADDSSKGSRARCNTFLLGNNQDGICGSEAQERFAENPTMIYKCFNEIACGYYHNAAIDETGRVYTWGRSEFGQLGQGEVNNQAMPCRLAQPLQNVVVTQISCGWQHTLAVTSNGYLFSWGLNINGQLGLGDYSDRDKPTLVESVLCHQVSKISAGHSHSAMINENGNVYSWGANPDSRLCRKTSYFKLSHRPKNVNKPMF